MRRPRRRAGRWRPLEGHIGSRQAWAASLPAEPAPKPVASELHAAVAQAGRIEVCERAGGDSPPSSVTLQFRTVAEAHACFAAVRPLLDPARAIPDPNDLVRQWMRAPLPGGTPSA